ncbi:MAG: hypothetical protein ACRC06_17640 [Waterburya sp.]
MATKNNNLPIGKLLQNAGLISEKQLENALNLQVKYTKMKLGEILVLQEGLKPKTIDFFVNRWSKINTEGRQFPIGYYLKNADLLKEEQIQTILTEQKQNKLKFGTLVVQKGWLNQNTIDFFLDTLSIKPPQLVSLDFLEKYNQKKLHLERKYANPDLILNRVLAWTGGIPTLTKTICNIFATSDFNIPASSEANAVDQFIESSVIKNWQTTQVGSHIRILKENLINNQRCDSFALLQEYRQILLSGNRKYQATSVQKELLILGLVVAEGNQLRVTNLIYQQIFNQDWIIEQKTKLQQVAITTIDKVNDNGSTSVSNNDNYIAYLDNPSTQAQVITPNNYSNSRQNYNVDNTNTNTPEPITKMSSWMVLVGIVLLIPLILVINNYYSILKPKAQPQLASESIIDTEKLEQFCNNLNLVQSESSLNLISQIEKDKEKILANFPKQLEPFPDNCEQTLNKLRVLAAPQLGKENRVFEAIRHLCKIPSNSEMHLEAELWLHHWYKSPSWGKETELYIEQITEHHIGDCPAGHFIEEAKK